MAQLMSPVDIAWLAGILEGEGCFTVTPKGYAKITLAMTDEDVVRRAANMLGGTTKVHCYVYGKTPTIKPIYRWQLYNRRDVARILLAIYPLMGRRRQAKIAEVVDATRWTRKRVMSAPVVHGTNAGYHRERYLGLPTCYFCRAAHAARWRQEAC